MPGILRLLDQRPKMLFELAHQLAGLRHRAVREWLGRIDKDTKEARDQRIFELWMACCTQQEIATACDVSQGEVAKSIPNGDLAERNKNDQACATHAVDFDLPIYNIWKQQEKTAPSVGRPGRHLPVEGVGDHLG